MKAEIHGKFVTATTNAIRMKCKMLNHGEGEVWIPKSQISYKRIDGTPTEKCRHPRMVLRIPVWLAEKNGMDYEEI